ncbi:hypothetical protein GPL06_11980 [Bacteroides salyersiae]|nr:hypothetical protein [Bacteroides salyersiae]
MRILYVSACLLCLRKRYGLLCLRRCLLCRLYNAWFSEDRSVGASVNPARSIGPALFEGGVALSQLWLFIVAPFVGAALSAGIWKILSSDK